MTEKTILTIPDVDQLAASAAKRIAVLVDGRRPRVYAVPRGGVPAALAIARHREIDFVGDPDQADYIVDDLIDSGATMKRFVDASDGRFGWPSNVVVLLDKRTEEWRDRWIVFPWEGDADGSIEDNVRRMLQFVGEDPNRGGLLETPARVAKAWEFWCSGYDIDPAKVLKTFKDGAEGCDEMVVVRDLPFYTHCEHHMAPFFGTATIAYIPNGKIVGLSKLARLLDLYARRLQVQERLTAQVVDAIWEHLKPKGAGVVLKARHLCMESRGVCQQGHHTRTSALRGVFKDQAAVRAEFLALDS